MPTYEDLTKDYGERIDLGSSVSVWCVNGADGNPEGLVYWHPCTAKEHEGFEDTGSYLPLKRDGGGPAWQLVSREPLTIAPSVLCVRCGFHGFIRNGRWESC